MRTTVYVKMLWQEKEEIVPTPSKSRMEILCAEITEEKIAVTFWENYYTNQEKAVQYVIGTIAQNTKNKKLLGYQVVNSIEQLIKS
jgi:hypothetical protein